MLLQYAWSCGKILVYPAMKLIRPADGNDALAVGGHGRAEGSLGATGSPWATRPVGVDDGPAPQAARLPGTKPSSYALSLSQGKAWERQCESLYLSPSLSLSLSLLPPPPSGRGAC